MKQRDTVKKTRGGTIYKVDVNSALIDLESSLMYRYFARCSKDFFTNNRQREIYF